MSLVDDALALYLCDDAAGGTMADSTANGNNGTLEGGAAWATIGGEACLDLSTGTDSRVLIGDLAIEGTAFSVLFRARFTALANNSYFIDKYLTTGNQRSWRIETKADGRIAATISSDLSTIDTLAVVTAGFAVVNTWANFACTFDGNGTMTYTVRKDDTTNTSDTSVSHTSAANSTADLYIGFRGTLDNNVYLRNIVLLQSVATAQQITDHHNEIFVAGNPHYYYAQQ